jgi:hypothetical protein
MKVFIVLAALAATFAVEIQPKDQAGRLENKTSNEIYEIISELIEIGEWSIEINRPDRRLVDALNSDLICIMIGCLTSIIASSILKATKDLLKLTYYALNV